MKGIHYKVNSLSINFDVSANRVDELVTTLAQLIVPEFSPQVYLLEQVGCQYPLYRELALSSSSYQRAAPGSSDRAYVKHWRMIHNQATSIIIKHPGSVDVAKWKRLLKEL